MKKIFLNIFALSLASVMALAQGTVNFQSANANAYVGIGTITPTPVGAGFLAAFYGGPAGAPEYVLVQLGATAPVTAGSGLVIGGGTRTNAFVAGGAIGAFQVRAWMSTNGATWEAAVTDGKHGYAGKTPVFNNPTGNPAASPPGTPAFLTGWVTPLIVTPYPIPEPSSCALVGPASVMLFVLRAKWRKQSLPLSVPNEGRIFHPDQQGLPTIHNL